MKISKIIEKVSKVNGRSSATITIYDDHNLVEYIHWNREQQINKRNSVNVKSIEIDVEPDIDGTYVVGLPYKEWSIKKIMNIYNRLEDEKICRYHSEAYCA